MLAKAKRLLSGKGGHDVFRNMLVLLAGSVAARIVGALSIPVLTRLYSPDDLGTLSVYGAILNLILPFGTLLFAVALPIPTNNRAAINLLALCGVILAIVASSVLGIFSLFGDDVLRLLSAERLLPYIALIPLGLVGASAYDILSSWAVRKKAFRSVSGTQFSQAISGSIVKITLGFLGFQPVGLLIGQIVQQTGGTLVLARQFSGDVKRASADISLRRLAYALRRYAGFPIYRLPSQLLLAFSMQAPVLFVSATFDIGTAGQFGLAMTALSLPVSLFSKTVGQAYFGEIARVGKSDPQRIHVITVDVIWKMAALAVGPTVALVLLGPWLFSLVFGDRWEIAGLFARYLSLYLLFLFTCQPLVQVLTVFENNKTFLALNAVRAVLLVAFFRMALYAELEATSFVILYSAVMCAYYLFVGCTIVLITRAKSRNSIGVK